MKWLAIGSAAASLVFLSALLFLMAWDTGGGWYGYSPLASVTYTRHPGIGYLSLAVHYVGQTLSIAIGVALGVAVALWYYDRHIRRRGRGD